MKDRTEFIDALVSDAEPTGRYWSPAALALFWFVGSWIFVVSATLVVAALRPGALGQLLTSERCAIEMLAGLLAGGVAIRAGVMLGFPRPAPVLRMPMAAVGMLMLWLGLQLCGLWAPALEPSMLGKREFCAYETFLYGTPPMLAGLLILRSRASFNRVWTGGLIGATAGAVPGLLMQLACMYVPEHILVFHLGPAAVLAAVGAALGPLILRRI